MKTKVGPGDISLLNETASVSNSLEFGGGSDGALFSLRYKTGDRIAVNHEYAHWFLDIEADLSPGDSDSESLIYGRINSSNRHTGA